MLCQCPNKTDLNQWNILPIPNLLELAKALIRLPTINPPGNEAQAVDLLLPLLEGAGFECMRVHHWDHSESLIAKLGPGPYLCMTGHLDVVPLGKAPWTKEPFAGQVEGDQLFGRGASDMKGGIAALVTSAIEAAQTHKDQANLLLILTAFEETGCLGAQDLLEKGLLKDSVTRILVCEPTSNRVDLGHKGSLWLEATCLGVTAHGSMPHLGVNALYKACELILGLKNHRFAVLPHPLLGGPTLNIGTLKAGLNVNSVPDRASFTIDIRLVPPMVPEQVFEEIARVLGPETELKIIDQSAQVDADPLEPWTASVLKRVFEVTKEEQKPYKGGVYVTDASVLWPAFGCPPCVVLGPGELAQAHKTDEYCMISRLHQAVEIYRLILDDHALANPPIKLC